MTEYREWVRCEAGEWRLFNKPASNARERLARRPIGSITGFARVGFYGSITLDGNAQFRAPSVQAVKRMVEAALAPAREQTT